MSLPIVQLCESALVFGVILFGLQGWKFMVDVQGKWSQQGIRLAVMYQK